MLCAITILVVFLGSSAAALTAADYEAKIKFYLINSNAYEYCFKAILATVNKFQVQSIRQLSTKFFGDKSRLRPQWQLDFHRTRMERRNHHAMDSADDWKLFRISWWLRRRHRLLCLLECDWLLRFSQQFQRHFRCSLEKASADWNLQQNMVLWVQFRVETVHWCWTENREPIDWTNGTVRSSRLVEIVLSFVSGIHQPSFRSWLRQQRESKACSQKCRCR